MQNKRAICVMMTVAILGPGHLCFAATNVAVFNFQMKSDTPDWKWLEKGLSDRAHRVAVHGGPVGRRLIPVATNRFGQAAVQRFAQRHLPGLERADVR